MADTVNMEKTWVLACHSELTKAFPGLLPSKCRKPAWRKFSLRCFSRSSSARDTVGNRDASAHMLPEEGVLHLSVTSRDHQEHQREEPMAHMLTQQVDQGRVLTWWIDHEGQ